VRLLLRDSIARQKVNNRLGLDFEFAGQLVDSDLICFAHASYGPFHGQKTQSPLLRPTYLLFTASALPLPWLRLQNVEL
jgi:hypothetical protein